MNSELTSLVRNNIRNLQPYSSARDEYTGEAAVWLDANESPYEGGVELVLRDPATGKEILVAGAGALNRYPDPYHRDLRQEIARRKGVPPERVFLGNGSDEILDLLFRTFCEPGRDEVLLQPPTYGMYGVLAAIHGTPVKEVSLDETFQPDTETILKAVTGRTKMIFFCSPNNPTGNTMDLERVVQVLEAFDGLVVVDEAYIDFAPEKSLLSLTQQYERLVVLQTFSKARGLAGIRLGMAFGHPELFGWLNRVKMPYNLNRLTLTLAATSFGREEELRKNTKVILQERERLRSFLEKLPVVRKVYPSEANFLLVCFDDARSVYEYLLERKIVVRVRTRIPGCGEAIRITVGTRGENDILMQALGDMK